MRALSLGRSRWVIRRIALNLSLSSDVDYHDAPVLRGVRVLRNDRVQRTSSYGLQPVGRHTHLPHQIVLHRLGPTIRQRSIVRSAADRVGVAFDQEEVLVLELLV